MTAADYLKRAEYSEKLATIPANIVYDKVEVDKANYKITLSILEDNSVKSLSMS
jgi:hypothetical protein